MALSTDLSDTMTESIIGVLEGRFLIFYVDLILIQPTGFKTDFSNQNIIKPLIITEEFDNPIRTLSYQDTAYPYDRGNAKFISLLSVLDAYCQFNGYAKGEIITFPEEFKHTGFGFEIDTDIEGMEISNTDRYYVRVKLDLGEKPDLPVVTTTTAAPIIQTNPPTGNYFPYLLFGITILSSVSLYYILSKKEVF